MFKTIKKLPSMAYHWIMPNVELFVSSKQTHVWCLAGAIGLAVSVAAIIFREMIGFFQLFWLQDSSEKVITAAYQIPWYVILVAPAMGGAVVGWILTSALPQRRCLGVPDVIEARALSARQIRSKPALWSALATTISLGSGASTGREGPMVHLGAAIAASMERWFDLPAWSKKTLLASGAAAAVSASFNAPIAGVLFAHEIVLGHYSRRSFVPIVISAVGGTLASRLYFGNVAAFEISAFSITSLWEFPAFRIARRGLRPGVDHFPVLRCQYRFCCTKN